MIACFTTNSALCNNILNKNKCDLFLRDQEGENAFHYAIKNEDKLEAYSIFIEILKSVSSHRHFRKILFKN